MPTLHTLHDGSTLRLMGAKELVALPIWKGNRIIDRAHVAGIQVAIGPRIQSLDSGYKIVQYDECDATGRLVTQSYIIDGQHRTEVLREHFRDTLCEPDFPVVVLERKVSSELEAIAYFNALNNTKPIHWSDPNLVINKYITELELVFNTKKVSFLRKGTTRRPYLSVDALREALMKQSGKLKESDTEIKAFVSRVQEWNKRALARVCVDMTVAKAADAAILQRGLDVGFMLATNTRLPWIVELL